MGNSNRQPEVFGPRISYSKGLGFFEQLRLRHMGRKDAKKDNIIIDSDTYKIWSPYLDSLKQKSSLPIKGIYRRCGDIIKKEHFGILKDQQNIFDDEQKKINRNILKLDSTESEAVAKRLDYIKENNPDLDPAFAKHQVKFSKNKALRPLFQAIAESRVKCDKIISWVSGENDDEAPWYPEYLDYIHTADSRCLDQISLLKLRIDQYLIGAQKCSDFKIPDELTNIFSINLLSKEILYPIASDFYNHYGNICFDFTRRAKQNNLDAILKYDFSISDDLDSETYNEDKETN